jgi:hypothetical protein
MLEFPGVRIPRVLYLLLRSGFIGAGVRRGHTALGVLLLPTMLP